MAHLELTFLGGFQASLDQEPLTHFRSANNQGLLIYLALNQERAIAREFLTTLFWPDDSDQNGRNNLRQAIYQLRTLLGDIRTSGEPQLIVTRQTVQFNANGEHILDAAQFQAAIDARDLDGAVCLYKGELLPGFTCDSLPFEEWLRQERESHHYLALEAMFELAADHLRRGEYDQAQNIARRQLTREPWREPACRQLIEAYARAGDRAGALAYFDQFRTTLWEELGLEPDAETITLVEAVKTGRYAPAAVDSLSPPPRFRHNLPVGSTPLIGRELEMEKLSGLLLVERQRLVTILGPGGMGKTRLALALGAVLLQDLPDGVFFVDLAALNRASEIPLAIAAAIDFQAADKSASLAAQLLTMLSRRHLLLIMDNFEHLPDGGALINDILQQCPKVSLLVTSRQRLNLASETRFELGGLDYPETTSLEDAIAYTAVHLFVDSGHRANTQFELNAENLSDVICICRLVQGTPLALLLAAAWLEMLSPREIAAEIEASLDFLAADFADLPPRQRSMQAVFGRSWKQMSDIEQAVMARLSRFRGGFTRQAAEEVAGANLRILLSLVNKSHLQRHVSEGRFTMHELLRQYAAAQQENHDTGDEASLAHCRYYAAVVEEEVRRGLGFHPIHLPRTLAADRDNIGNAWAYAIDKGLAAEGTLLTKGVIPFLVAQGIQPLGFINKAIQGLRGHGFDDADRNMLALRLWELCYQTGFEEHDRIRLLLLDLLPDIEVNGDPKLRFWAYERLCGLTYDLFGASPEFLDHWQHAYQVGLETKDELFIKMVTAMDLQARMITYHEYDETLPELTRLLADFEAGYPQSNVVFNLNVSLSTIYQVRERFNKAIEYGKRCLRIAKGWQDLYWISTANIKLADIYLSIDQPRQAALRHLDTLNWHLAVGQIWQTLGNLFALCAFNPNLIGGREAAAPILSTVYHHPELAPFHRMEIEVERERIGHEMGSSVFDQAWARGKSLSFDSAVAQVRAALSGSQPAPR